MLILTRKIHQSIVIDDNIFITFLGQTNDRFRLGINAPKNVSVLRNEVHDKLKIDKDYKLKIENKLKNMVGHEAGI